MAKRVSLDGMIPRADFGQADKVNDLADLFKEFPLSYLSADAPIFKLLRKPDFQRETNHWSPDQIATFVESFLDKEVIPSLILWKSPMYIFVIDGGHRLSALRAWMTDDYGDRTISEAFYDHEISQQQKDIGQYTRNIVESRIGRYTTLDKQVDAIPLVPRANTMFTRALTVQWVYGSPDVAESSFFKINSQGTPLDDTEGMLIKNRKKPIAIAARAILRAGGGHKYWSAFKEDQQAQIKSLAAQFHDLLFDPEAETPVKTLELPLGGSIAPLDALSLLIDFLTIASSKQKQVLTIDKYPDDETGEGTISVLKNSLQVMNRLTGNTPGSLGLHPAVYFYNERGRYARFLFLGMVSLISEKIRNNDSVFFKKFTQSRGAVEAFLLSNKSLITYALTNMSKAQRALKVKELFEVLVSNTNDGKTLSALDAFILIGMSGRILEVNLPQQTPQITDDSKSMVFIKAALEKALKCPVCNGLLDPKKSLSYDHKLRVRDGGTGDPSNAQMTHPYCNTGYKESTNKEVSGEDRT